MKTLSKAIRLTLVFCAFLGVFYVFTLWVFAQAITPNGGNVETIEVDGKAVGAVCVGQQFSSDRYFWGRPSCAGDGYDAANSCGSNKGATNEEYLAEVESRIDSFVAHHPYLRREEVPAEMVTASGSGLDPHISPQAAMVQAARVAQSRGVTVDVVKQLVERSIESPLAGLFGTAKVNVLKLNVELDKMCN